MSLLAVPVRLGRSAIRKILSWPATAQAAHLLGEPVFWLAGMRGSDRAVDPTEIERVLVVRLDQIGDVAMTTPLLRELRRNLPDAWISLVVNPTVYNLVELCPYVNEVLSCNGQVRGRFPNLRLHGRALRLARHSLWRRRFDLAILPRWDADYYHGTFILYFSGATWRMGYSENVNVHKQCLNGGFDRLLTHVLDDKTPKHEVEHNLETICCLGGQVQDNRLELWLSEEDKVFAEQFLRNHHATPDDLLVGLVPGAGELKRMWPIDRFAELGSWLQHAHGARLLVVGGPGEEPLGEGLQRALGAFVINAVGRATLRETAALLQHCRLLVSNDSGPMHMAAAVGVPVVELSCHPESGCTWSFNSPLRFRPWGENHTVIQPKAPSSPCFDECVADQAHCILGIAVEQVKQAVVDQLRQGRAMVGRPEQGR